MPKQLYKITQFYGGLNSNSDARDIAENQLSSATDIMVDKVGRITMLGSFGTHDDVDANTATASKGRGLFQFSHDRKGGHVAREHLNETGFATHSNWDVTGTCVDSGGNLEWQFGGGNLDGTAQQVYGDRAQVGIPGLKYAFTYTVAVTTAPNYFTLTLENFASASITLPFTAGRHTVTFTSHDNVATSEFTITGTDDVGGVTSQGQFTIDDVSLYIIDETGDDYLALTDAATTTVDIWSKHADAWGVEHFDLGTATSGFEPSMYAVDGALRVCDGNYANTSTSKWFGYIKRTNFSGLSNEMLLDGWYALDQEIKAGTLANGNITANAGSYTGSPVDPGNLDSNGYVTLRVEANTGDTGGMRGLKRYYYSLIYDGIQESKLTDFGFTDTTQINSTKRYKVCICPASFDGVYFSKRVTGLKVYWKKIDSAEVAYDDAYLLLIADFVSGVKSPNSNTYVAWADSGSNGQVNTSYIEFTDEPRFETYRTQTGFSEDCISLAAKYKTAVVANRMTYIGNILAKNKQTPASATTMGDAMIKSPVNQFDSFPTDRTLEVTIRDGDEIIHLVEFADRILQFKKNKLYIINISQEIEFLEDELDNKGVNSPGSVAKTDMGIVWANRHGVFLYDGQKVSNVLERNGLKTISDSEWDAFLPADKDPMVGYIPNKRQVIVADTCGTGDGSGDGAIFLFDFVTQSWIKGSAATITDAAKSNFAIDWDGELIYHDGSNAIQWNDAPASSNDMLIRTKDIDFGQPGQLKNIYKVYLTYQGDARNVQAYYGVDGFNPASTFFTITSGTDGSSTGATDAAKCLKDAGVTDWLKAELKPGAGTIKNINSFRLTLRGDASNAIASDFQINDITIVFRIKGTR